ncbi:MAG TPA: sigma-70 family RNA polymerase sigma factor [Actinomycetota bacterium]|nr:sigma-70 family RNA polymerase sigma factor [Actinomycetota bacterium]
MVQLLRAQSRADTPDEILAQGAADDNHAFTELYRRYLGPVHRYMRYQAPHEEAEDLTAQVFMQAYRGASQFRGEGASYRAWLFRIAHNTLATYRRVSRRTPIPLSEIPDQLDDAPDPAAGAADRELRLIVRSIVDELPAADRELIELRYVEGLAPQEIAHVTGASDGAIRVRIHRLLKRLRPRLVERGVRL